MRATEFTQPRSAGCIVVAADTGRWCLQQRSNTVTDPGVWSTWGGGSEPGETLPQTVRRELAEESGYTGPVQLTLVDSRPEYATFVALVPHEFEPRINSECQDWCWCEPDQLPEPLHPGLAQVISAQLQENRSFNRCYDRACQLYNRAAAKGVDATLVQVADYQGDGSAADSRWQQLPQRVWQHYVTVIGDTVYDPTAEQFGAGRPKKYSIDELKSQWKEIYTIRSTAVKNDVVDKQSITEYRDRMYQYIKSIVPKWPDYVVKDWLYANFARGATQGQNFSFHTIGKDIPMILSDLGLSTDTKWQLVPDMEFNMEMWEPVTLKRLQARAGGNSNPTDPDVHVPAKDAERHATQAALAKQQGGIRKEPVILIKTSNGYELIEGWHRTIQHFKMYPNGYRGPAYVAVAQNQQDVAENFADGKIKGKSRPGRVKRAGASCKGSVTDLRARAKKYSGERAKMYHWCANMKSGKKNK